MRQANVTAISDVEDVVTSQDRVHHSVQSSIRHDDPCDLDQIMHDEVLYHYHLIAFELSFNL